jgi:hypothetical protein
MKLLQLSKGMFAQVNNEDYQRCIDYGPWYYNPQTGYAYTQVGRQKVMLHHFIFNETCEVDDRDRDRLNCQSKNLRRATRSQNCGNSSLQRRNRFGRKGIRIERNGRYIAQLCGKYLGTFDIVGEAGDAYDKAAKQHYGEYYGV